MSKTTDAIEELNDTQKKAIKALCNGELDEATKKGWSYTGRKFHGKTVDVMHSKGLVYCDVDDSVNRYMVKPTSLGRRVGKALMLTILALCILSCGDKIQTAKMVLGFVGVGTQTADMVFDAYAASEKARCLKKGAEGSPEFIACYKKTADIMAKWVVIKPKLEKANKNAADYIKAVESGKVADYAAAVKESVCLLTQVAEIIPGKWKEKIEVFLALAGAYACDKPTATTPAQDIHTLRIVHRLMSEMLGHA